MQNDIFVNPSLLTWAIQKFKNWFEPNSLVRISNNNKLRDYRQLFKKDDAQLWQLHADIADVIDRMQREYKSYDYGNGYFYQSFDRIGVSGYRNTTERVENLNLKNYVNDRTVLDIGCNAGFLMFELASSFTRATGVEYNPYLIDTANLVKKFIGGHNIELINAKFEDFALKTSDTFDVVLSLANHSTYDGNTSQSLDEYFSNINKLLTHDGTLIFESHPPEIEPEDKLKKTLQIIEENFVVMEKKKLSMTSFLDKNRTYVYAKKR